MKIIREVFEDIPSEVWLFAFIGGIIGGYLLTKKKKKTIIALKGVERSWQP